MKFALNHPYLFEKKKTSWLISFLGAFSNYMVEQCNVFVILTSFHGIGLVGNFIALQVIGNFGTFFYSSLGSEPLKNILSDEVAGAVFVVQHTTSKRCKDYEVSEVLDEDDNPRPLKITFGRRTCQNRVGWAIYKFMRGLYVMYYFYFMPLFLLGFSLGLPVYWGKGQYFEV
jgi:hypothetical protein